MHTAPVAASLVTSDTGAAAAAGATERRYLTRANLGRTSGEQGHSFS